MNAKRSSPSQTNKLGQSDQSQRPQDSFFISHTGENSLEEANRLTMLPEQDNDANHAMHNAADGQVDSASQSLNGSASHLSSVLDALSNGSSGLKVGSSTLEARRLIDRQTDATKTSGDDLTTVEKPPTITETLRNNRLRREQGREQGTDQ